MRSADTHLGFISTTASATTAATGGRAGIVSLGGKARVHTGSSKDLLRTKLFPGCHDSFYSPVPSLHLFPSLASQSPREVTRSTKAPCGQVYLEMGASLGILSYCLLFPSPTPRAPDMPEVKSLDPGTQGLGLAPSCLSSPLSLLEPRKGKGPLESLPGSLSSCFDQNS